MAVVSPADLAIPGPFSHELVYTRGTRLHAAVAGPHSAPLVLFLHDSLGGWFDFQYTFPQLSDSFHVVAMSHRGFGQSDKPPTGYSLRYAVGDVSGIIRALGHGRATVVAAGSAARIALALAANYPERVRCSILIDPLSRRDLIHPLLSRFAQRFPETIARRSLRPLADSATSFQELANLRSLSYQVKGTVQARTIHGRFAQVPLPLSWTLDVRSPVIRLHGMPHVAKPAGFAHVVAQATT